MTRNYFSVVFDGDEAIVICRSGTEGVWTKVGTVGSDWGLEVADSLNASEAARLNEDSPGVISRRVLSPDVLDAIEEALDEA